MSAILREDFEAWVKQQPYFGYKENEFGLLLERDLDGGYTDACVHAAWIGWNAATRFLSGVTIHGERSELYTVDRSGPAVIKRRNTPQIASKKH